jgi:uncharacterized protein (TIGR02118 family)
VYKLVILFPHPPDLAAFETHWSQQFVALAEKMPGLQRVTVSHTHGGPAGPVAIYLIHELHFADQSAMTAAMDSPAGRAAGQYLVQLAPAATLLFAEHMEDFPQAH